jgi:hypothetical protein
MSLQILYVFLHNGTNEESEPACRLNIGLFLINAIRLANAHTETDDIALFSEVYCDADFPVLGKVHGNLDYLTSSYTGSANIHDGIGGLVRMKRPNLLVVEAMKGSTCHETPPPHSS